MGGDGGKWGVSGGGEGLQSVQDKKVTRGGSNSLEQMTAANLGIYIPGDLYPYTSYEENIQYIYNIQKKNDKKYSKSKI